MGNAKPYKHQPGTSNSNPYVKTLQGSKPVAAEKREYVDSKLPDVLRILPQYLCVTDCSLIRTQ